MTLGTFLLGVILYKCGVLMIVLIAGALMGDDPITTFRSFWNYCNEADA